MLSPLRQTAQAIADVLRGHAWIEAVCLFGSVARGDETPWSDIDLLVIGSRAEATRAEIVEALPPQLRESHLSLLYRSSEELARLSEEQGIFVDHIRREGIILHDSTGQLTRALSGDALPWSNVEAELESELVRLRPYENLERFSSNFLFCLSHLYAIGKSIVILDLAKEGVFEFNRDEAFRKFRTLRPDKADEIETIAQLQPFYYLVTGRKSDPLPFSYYGSKHEAEAAIKAIKTLADVGFEDSEYEKSHQPVSS
jgi:predicted nucleotidyltransferase